MTQGELASRLSLGRTSITNLEKGRQNPPLSLLPELARALGVDLLRLIAIAIGVSDDRDVASLTSKVHDADLRRWAGQIIGDTLTSPPTRTEAPRSKPGQLA
jgi:transcriptional regulator with XRE-family HTH domain